MLVNVETYLPILIAHDELFGPDNIAHLLKSRVDFVSEINDFLVFQNSYVKESETTYIVTPPENIALLIKEERFSFLSKYVEYLKIDSIVEFDSTLKNKLEKDDIFTPRYIESLASLTISETIDEALFFSELAFPGYINTLRGVSISGSEIYYIKRKGTFLSLGNPESSDPIWPNLNSLGLIDCLTWARKIGFDEEGFATNRISKALASFSHVVELGYLYEGEVLFRCMQGLEAFYCDSVGDLRRQLSEKSALWLGRWNEKKNIVGHLYDMRSKFIHGSSPIEYSYHNQDTWSENRKLSQENAYASIFALRLLIATLQKCITENVTDIVWSYNCEVVN